jgi:uncharacterized protein YegJ (DUF2314 family)
LESAVGRHQEAPDSFEIPSDRARRRLRAQDGAKLLFFLDDENGNAGVERMWVRVTETRTDSYTGRLENQPVTCNVIERGTLVEFGPDHIADIIRHGPRLMRLLRR